MNYYNEHDALAAAWLRELIVAGLIPDGEVDERDVQEVKPVDLVGFAQCHFFAGIGGWSYALHLAGWSTDRPVWTASLPCQPYSQAGQQKAENDERHLWPVFYELVKECRPSVCFGEQVASPLGREWLAGVRADLEATGYRVGAANLCAAGVGAPHIRQRLYWVADARSAGVRAAGFGAITATAPRMPATHREQRLRVDAGTGGATVAGGLGVPNSTGSQSGRQAATPTGHGRAVESAGCTGRLAVSDRGECGRLADGEGCERDGTQAGRIGSDGQFESRGDVGSLGDAGCQDLSGERRREEGRTVAESSGASGHWSDFDLAPCADGKARRVKSGLFPLAYGFPRQLARVRTVLEGMGFSPAEVRRKLRRPASILAMAGRSRVVQLKCSGNAIVGPLAAQFIAAYMEIKG